MKLRMLITRCQPYNPLYQVEEFSSAAPQIIHADK